ncbi:thiol:disulfide interchange protein DsbA/DsbL [Kistimonas asteriae]|uniref:thiol:disulfide interchange protein DsbA/DsbL n=1 Tax=Kistimonas asteriae TaxID=517724 RepID=UPI001BAAB87A|nr:thiol:disulfide interchange protein DsbA/DsbL [Kistimonas asteriae]
MRKLLCGLIMAIGLVVVQAQADEYRAGQQYKVLKEAVSVEQTDGKIEVDTIFWYGCPHCYDLEKLIPAWKKTLSADVDVVKTPVIFGRPWQPHAQLFYTLEEMGLDETANTAIFEAVQKEGKRLDKPADMADFLNEHFKVNKETFLKTYDSFGVRNQSQKAYAKVRGAQLMGVPALIIDGRYVVDPQSAGGLEEMLKVADALVDKVRREKAPQQKAATAG